MGFAPEVFAAMTPAEFFYAWLGWAHREERSVRQAWEREQLRKATSNLDMTFKRRFMNLPCRNAWNVQPK